MPFQSNRELPKAVKNALPEKAQSIFRSVVNAQLKEGLNEKRALKSAWGALKNQGWVKQANGKWIKVKKMDIKLIANIEKTNDDQNMVFGWFSVIEKDGKSVVDSQGDTITEAELENAMYDFVLNARDAGEMHMRKDAGKLVECMVFTKEKQELMGIDLGFIGAWGGFKLDDETFSKVKSGQYKMFSIGGTGTRV